jgi:hypothetical protein
MTYYYNTINIRYLVQDFEKISEKRTISFHSVNIIEYELILDLL